MAEGWGFNDKEIAEIRAKIIKDFSPGGMYYKELVQGMLKGLRVSMGREVRALILADLREHFTKELKTVVNDGALKEKIQKAIVSIVSERVDNMFKENYDDY